MKFYRSLATTMLLLITTSAFPHTTVSETVPRSGSVLQQSPSVVELQFAHAARLTSVVLVEADKSERRLEFTPGGNAISFQFPEPDLGPGRNEIRWKALSDDGHVISGSLIYTIKPN
jgi:methionine-rich copper-binding protein CopC